MLNLLWKLAEDGSDAEARVLADMVKQHPELPDWSAAVQPLLDRVLLHNGVKRALATGYGGNAWTDVMVLSRERPRASAEVSR